MSGGRAALSIVDMDQEREVDLIYLTPQGAHQREDGAVVSLRIYSLPSAPDSAAPRLLLAMLGSGDAYSLVLESSQDLLPDVAAWNAASSSLSSSSAAPTDDGAAVAGGGGSAASPPRPRRLSSSLLSTPTKQPPQQPGMSRRGQQQQQQFPPPSPGTPPGRSSSLSLSLSASPLSTVPASLSASASAASSFSSLMTGGTPQRHHHAGKKGGGRRKGGSGAQPPVPGFFPASSLGESVEEEQRDASSLWDRCFVRVDPTASGPMPRQPRPRQCFSAGPEQPEGAVIEGGCPLRVAGGAVVCLLAPPGRAEGAAAGALVARLDLQGQEGMEEVEYDGAVAVVLESHHCSLPLEGEEGPGGGSCAALLRVPVEEDLGPLVGPTRSVWVERLVEARLLGGPRQRLLVLSLDCAEEDDRDNDEAAGGEAAALRSFWLAIYSLGEGDGGSGQAEGAPPRLLRAFRSPTGSALRCLGALLPAPLAIRDVLALAPAQLFGDGGGQGDDGEGQPSGWGPEAMAAWSLVLWSRCSVLVLRMLGHDDAGGHGEETSEQQQQQPLPLLFGSPSVRPVVEDAFRPALASGLTAAPRQEKRPRPQRGAPDQQLLLNPGELLAFVRALACSADSEQQQQQRHHGRRRAITLAWRLLLDAPPPPKGPGLHPAFLLRLKGADPLLLPGGGGRAELALACLGWIMDDGEEEAEHEARWGKEDLLRFLEACGEYPLAPAVDLLLARGRVSEALFASWARGKVSGVARTLERLAALAAAAPSNAAAPTPCRRALPLTRSDVAWLCGVGAGQALVEAGRSLLWAGLPRRLQLDVLLANQRLLLFPAQYQDLLAALPALPRASLAAVALQLAFWLGVGPPPTDEEPPPLPMSPRLMVSPSPSRGARGGGGGGDQDRQRPVRLVAAWASDE